MNQRQELCAEILEDVARVISEELADAPSTMTEEARKAIEDDLIGETTRMLEAVSLQEMQSVGAQVTHLAKTRAEVQRLIRFCR